MKTRKIKIKIKPFKGIRRVYLGDHGYESTQLLEVFQEMGYTIYEDPTNETCVIISNRRLTMRDVKNRPGTFQIDLGWWNEETDFNDRLNEELDEISI